MNRTMVEAESAARRAGYRSAAQLIERRERERRAARLDSDFRRETERREHVRRETDRANVARWIESFERVRAELRAAGNL